MSDEKPETTTAGRFYCHVCRDEKPNQEIERLRAVVADLKCSVIAFGAPAMVEYARGMGLPKGHLYPSHYDILKQAGARMDSFMRAEVETHVR